MAHCELAAGVYAVGVQDWSRHDFHGFEAPRGVTYNCYLIVGEEVALIDTAHSSLVGELLHNVSGLVDPARINYVVSNHAEPDHSSGLPEVMKAAPEATVVCTAKCRAAFDAYYGGSWPYRIVKTGDTLSLGKSTLQFLATPMVHWPDSMMTYLPAEKIIFSMDAFGQHVASNRYFDDQLPLGISIEAARSYYANIITRLGSFVLRTLKAAEALDIRMIAPSHGVIWRKHIPAILEAYQKWASLKSDAKVVVVYDSMWHSTELMARAVMDGITRAGVKGRLVHLRNDGRTEAAAEILEAAALAIGTPTLHQGPMPEIAGFVSYVRGVAPVAPGKNDHRGEGRTALAFGSHGWSGGGASWVHQELGEIGYELLQPVICCVYRPDKGTLESCREAGAQLAERARKLAEAE